MFIDKLVLVWWMWWIKYFRSCNGKGKTLPSSPDVMLKGWWALGENWLGDGFQQLLPEGAQQVSSIRETCAVSDSFSGCNCCLQGILIKFLKGKDVSVGTTELEEKTLCTEILLPELSWHSCASKASVENSWNSLFLFSSSFWSILTSYVQCQQKGNTFLLFLLEIKGALSLSGVTLKCVLWGMSR